MFFIIYYCGDKGGDRDNQIIGINKGRFSMKVEFDLRDIETIAREGRNPGLILRFRLNPVEP
jgi:hypothetical protein